MGDRRSADPGAPTGAAIAKGRPEAEKPGRRLPQQPGDEVVRDLLRARGIRVTPQRLWVLRALARAGVPMSQSDVTAAITDVSLAPVSIYRHLREFLRVGLLGTSAVGDDVTRYELNLRTCGPALHPHFVCHVCGDIRCVERNAVEVLDEALLGMDLDIVLRGRCANCTSPARQGDRRG